MSNSNIGKRVRIFWQSEGEWFEGKIQSLTEENFFLIAYDDGDEEVIESLDAPGVELVPTSPSSPSSPSSPTSPTSPPPYSDSEDYSRQQDLLIDEQNNAITSSLQAALEEINLNQLQQEQDDQDEWLRDFFESQRIETERHEKSEEEAQLLLEAEIDLQNEQKQAGSPHSYSPSHGHGAPALFIDNFTKAATTAQKTQQLTTLNRTTAPPPATSGGMRKMNAAEEGCALLQGEVLSAKSLPGDDVVITNPFVKVLFVESGAKNIMFRCKTTIHNTEVQQDTHNPAWAKSKFSMELLPPSDSFLEIGGDIMFTVYDVNASGTQVFIGQASVSLNSLIAPQFENDNDEDDLGLAVPEKVDAWLPLLLRNNKKVGFGGERAKRSEAKRSEPG